MDVGFLKQSELGEDAANVRFQCLGADAKLRGDGAVGASLSHECQHLPFTPGEVSERVWSAGSQQESMHDVGVDDALPGNQAP